ncbi:glycosyltransferase family 4 protein [Synechocystis sp. PCC 7509]|uniref:glycosyltransferase family 4 protein n=1 Tax=Synechocystis sp. PCC 7509 TaxID=927677 RepID=UPI0002ACCD34|nr:glycosyltransferase [Synechocystis sp. PCC 7509]
MPHSKDLLVVSPVPSHPQDAGNKKRIYSLFKFLQTKSFKIHYLLYDVHGNGYTCDESTYDAMSAEWDYFDFLLPSSDRHKGFGNLRTKLLNSPRYSAIASKGIYLPIQYKIDDWCSDALINFVNWKCKNFAISTVFVEYVFLSKLLEFLPANIFKVIDTHDVFANRNLYMFKNTINSRFFTTSPKEEIKGLNRSNLVIAIQEEEKKYFEERTTSEVIELTHLEEEKFIYKQYNSLTSVGIIASSNPINVRSVQSFLDLIVETKNLSSIKIYIAGSVSGKISCSLPNVVILGQIDYLEHFYNLADLYINPMIVGTGIKIKTLEAFSYGVPLLSTEIGSVGTGSTYKFHNFPNLKELINHLDNLYVNQTSLESYQEASKACFLSYRKNLNLQLNSLLARLDR